MTPEIRQDAPDRKVGETFVLTLKKKHRRKERQTYTVMAVEPYQRKDGAASQLVTWQSECRTCGEPFVTVTGKGTTPGNRNCPEHHKRKAAIEKAKRTRAANRAAQ